MINTRLPVSDEDIHLEPFEDRIDILFRELELAAKWQRPSVLWAIYNSEYVRADADTALENRLHNLGQSTYHIKIKNQEDPDVSLQISELANYDNVVFFVDGLRWGASQDDSTAYHKLDNHREFLVDNQIRVVFWLTEKEAINLAHYAPDYWALRHRVIEFVDSPRPDQILPHILESAWQETGEFTDTIEDLDAKIAFRTALLTDLPEGDESTATRANLLLPLGILHWRRGDYEKATEFLNTALDLAARLEDNYFEALCFNAIALVQTDLGRIEEAIQAYQNVIELAPGQISPWNNLGHLFRKLGQPAQALAAFQKAVQHNASDAVGWNGLGDLYLEIGRNEDAVHAYRKAIEFSPGYAHSWSGLGNSHLNEGRLDDALGAHQKALEIDRRTVKSWLGLGDIYRLQGNSENASMAYRTALELDPKNGQAWNELGNLYYNAGAHEEAIRSYRRCIESNQGCCLTYGNLASIYIFKGLHAEAIPILLRGLEISDDIPGTARLWKLLGDAYQQLNEYDNAVAAYRKAEALASETTSLQAELSAPATDSQPAPSKDFSDQPLSHRQLDTTDEELLAPAFSKPALDDSPDKAGIPEVTDTASTRPEDEFVEWLDGLASVLPVTSQIDMTGSLSSPIEGGYMDSAKEFETEADSQADKIDKPILPVELETRDLSESSLESQNSLYMEGTETTPTNNYPDCTIYDEAAVNEKNFSQVDMAMGKDTGQGQVTINEKNAQIWNELGNIYFNSGAFDEAMHAFEMAVELDPSYGWSYNNLASIYFHQKQYADAIPLYEKGLQLLDDQKDKAVLWNRMGDAYRRLNERGQAVTAYRKAMELDPDNVSLLTRARFCLLGNLRA